MFGLSRDTYCNCQDCNDAYNYTCINCGCKQKDTDVCTECGKSILEKDDGIPVWNAGRLGDAK